MSDFNKILDQLSGEENERLLKVARFAELGLSASAAIHEIRQPLTALSMSLQMSLENWREAKTNPENGLIEAIALVSKTELLLERARDFMRPSGELTRVDLIDCITKVLSSFQWQQGPNSGILFKAHVPKRLPAIQADTTQIEQMLTNLVANGLDAVTQNHSDNHNKGGVVYVHAKEIEGSGMEIIVADNGIGMSETVRQQAFEPFFSTKGDRNGTGLGLFIVSQIVSRYNGRYRLLSKPELAGLDFDSGSTGIALFFPSEVLVE